MRTAINNKLPAKIDIGPVYNVDPKHRNAYAGKPSRVKLFTSFAKPVCKMKYLHSILALLYLSTHRLGGK